MTTLNYYRSLNASDTHAYIPPFRAYIEATVSGARMLDSSFRDEATGIYSLRTVDRDGTERYYDLNGRRIDDPKRQVFTSVTVERRF